MSHYPKETQGGSMKRKIVNPDLLEERAKLAFDKQDVSDVILDKKVESLYKEYAEDLIKHPEYRATEEYYDMTRAEKMQSWWKRLALMYKNNPELYIFS